MPSKRTQARELALQTLYQWDLVPSFTHEEAHGFVEQQASDAEVRDYARVLVDGVMNAKDALDHAIRRHATNWDVSRMAVLDRNILRLAAFEMQTQADVPPRVAINEAVSLAKRYGSEKSGSFVNGVLDPMAAEQVWPGGSLQESNPD